MFVKKYDRPILTLNFKEAKEFEKQMLSLGSHPTTEETKLARKKSFTCD